MNSIKRSAEGPTTCDPRSAQARRTFARGGFDRLRRPVLGAGLLVLAMLLPAGAGAQTFDHGHARWDALLKAVVEVSPDGTRSAVRYRRLKADRAALDDVLRTLSAVSAAEYAGWSKPQRLAFLINAYNAFTIDLVLTRYPDLDSIKDIGGLFSTPWQQRFIPLLGQTISLDDLEHGLILAPGAFDEPRIHVAVVCASIGCPMLQADAFRADRLDAQLDDAMRRFLSDRTRNSFDAQRRTLRVSKLFDWYSDDFGAKAAGASGVVAYLARYADALTDREAEREAIRSGAVELRFTHYDWRLNDADAGGR